MKGSIPRPAAVFLLVAALAAVAGCGRKASDQSKAAPKSEAAPAPGEPGASGAAAATAEPQMIGASHILIAYQGALRSAATRTRDEAMARAQEVLAKAKAPGANFSALADEYSDDPSAKTNHGDLSVFSKGMMAPEFEQPAFKLQIGEISGVVETPFGFHIIKRTS